VVLEMPIDPQYFSLNKGLGTLYPQVREMLVNETAAAGVPLWLTQDSFHVPPDGWYDLIHLGKLGDTTLSEMVAERLTGILTTHETTSP